MVKKSRLRGEIGVALKVILPGVDTLPGLDQPKGSLVAAVASIFRTDKELVRSV